MDQFAGDNHDPPSLHKYLYAHCDPINNIDPSGNFSLTEMVQVSAIMGLVASAYMGMETAIRGGSVKDVLNAQTRWFWRGFAIGAIAYGGIWAIYSLWAFLAGGGVITAEKSARYGFETHDDLVEAWRAQGFNISRIQHVHHFVQQVESNIVRFGVKAINSLANSVPLDSTAHISKMHSYTNSSTTTLNLTQHIGQHYSHLHEYVTTLSWEMQYLWGVAMYNYVQIHDSMQGFDPVSQGLI